jgi:hypothetical protein
MPKRSPSEPPARFVQHFTTESGAHYAIRSGGKYGEAARLDGPYSPGIDYVEVPDAEFLPLARKPEIVVGQRAQLVFANGKWRITTPVLTIDKDYPDHA